MYRSFSRDVAKTLPRKYNANEVHIANRSLSKMDCSDNEAKSDENVEATSSVPLSDYAKKLDQRVKKRYEDKIAAIGIDPVLLEGKHFEPDCLPPMEATDILSYLVLETSYYTQNQFKAFRSLEAYNQMVSGFIASVEGHIRAIYTRKNKTRTVPFIRACLI